MKNPFLTFVLATALLVSVSTIGLAQETDRTHPDTDSSLSALGAEARIVVLTGCLDRGPGADEYTLYVGADLWELTSSGVDLSTHLDQTVIVTAVATNDTRGPLKVIDLRIETPSCNSW